MTQQEFFDGLVANQTALQSQIDGLKQQLVPLEAAVAKAADYVNYSNLIISLATTNNIALDNPKLLVCFDISLNLAIAYGNPNEQRGDVIAVFFNAIAKLLG